MEETDAIPRPPRSDTKLKPHSPPSSSPGIVTSWRIQALSASVASLISCIITQPLDVVKVRMQSQTPLPSPSTIAFANLPRSSITRFMVEPGQIGVTTCCREVFFSTPLTTTQSSLVQQPYCAAVTTPSSVSATECALETTRQRQFSGMFEALQKISRHEGLFALWRGLSATMLVRLFWTKF